MAVNEAENVIELTIYEYSQLERCSRVGLSRQPLCDDLPPLLEKIDAVKRKMMMQHNISKNEDLQLVDHSSSRHVASLNLENVVAGLEDDLMKIMRRLIGPPSSREIALILGLGGISKTTLAKKVYDHLEIRNRFDIHVWVTISQEYRSSDLWLGILTCIFQVTNIEVQYEIKESSDDQLMDMIYKKLKLSEVAEHADPDSNPHEMSLLNSDNSWKLLHDKVFGSQHVCPPELENVGKKIAQKCQGLPLALLVVAEHLSKISRTRECWDDVAKRISKIVASEPDKCLGVLGMSYSYLRDHLKACFLYMGAFPEDF
ncbi:putative late blight resistance protein homolog R1B-8 [Lycium ferocissimum]|uniref:putative late blight resistance protein homolog R1B-8 n=1 Tax=Lycium ferocissimum TaxID=112874 RepID=UPI0028160143|nr:putative late blight resistance protein homolog R1B-8 [Lycium ferocissimum]